jgi:DNA repair exonuclease SbcCD ATPase subunit
MIIFEKLRFKNFLSYGNSWTEVNLNQGQDTLIIGENGAGKSTFLDALSYALYMKPFRKINNPQLVNSINKKKLAVEIEFKVGSNSYKVCRGHAPRFFEVWQNGEMLNQDSHTKDYQKILEQNILKMNYKSFTQIVVLGSRNFVPFMQLSTADRRSVIEDLLDIQIFSTMGALLKDRVSLNKSDILNIDYQMNLIEEKIKVQEDYIQQLKEDKSAEKEKVDKVIQGKEQEINMLDNACTELSAQVETLFTSIKDFDSLSAKSQKYIALETQITNKINTLEKKRTFFTINNNCPTCEQELQDDFKEKTISTTIESLTETKSGLASLETEIQRVGEILRGYRDIQSDIAALQTTIQSKSNTRASLQDFIRTLKEHSDSDSSSELEVPENAGRVEEYTEQLEQARVDRGELRDKQVVLNTATTLLRDTGIKARIIKQYVPVMNKLINKYLAAMEFFVDFHLDEDFKETIRSRHRDEFSYASFSEGEKMRIDLALLFTWRAIAKLKNSASTNLLIMDEIFDSSLDSGGTDEFLKIIKELTSDTNIIIISHKTDQLLDKFTNVIRFEKHKNFSRIV